MCGEDLPVCVFPKEALGHESGHRIKDQGWTGYLGVHDMHVTDMPCGLLQAMWKSKAVRHGLSNQGISSLHANARTRSAPSFFLVIFSFTSP